MADLKPFELMETTPGKYSLLLTEFEPAGAVFEEAGIDGGGYAWEGIAKHQVAARATDLEGKFDYDPEASMFCAYGGDRDALERLGVLLHDVFHDPDKLGEIIDEIGPDGFDD